MLQEKCRSANFRKSCGGEENCELLKAVHSEEPAESLKKDEHFDYYILLQPERVSTVKICLYTECIENWSNFQAAFKQKLFELMFIFSLDCPTICCCFSN
jgi:hypothetical protein